MIIRAPFFIGKRNFNRQGAKAPRLIRDTKKKKEEQPRRSQVKLETPREFVLKRKEPTLEVDHLAHSVIGAAIAVHRALGPGYIESIYEEAMCVELDFLNIAYQRQNIRSPFNTGIEWLERAAWIY